MSALNHLQDAKAENAADNTHENMLQAICAKVIEAVKGSPEDLMKIADMLQKEALEDVQAGMSITFADLA